MVALVEDDLLAPPGVRPGLPDGPFCEYKRQVARDVC